MTRCDAIIERPTKKDPKYKVRCIVPVLADGTHADGNTAHYNGNHHHTKDGQFTRG